MYLSEIEVLLNFKEIALKLNYTPILSDRSMCCSNAPNVAAQLHTSATFVLCAFEFCTFARPMQYVHSITRLRTISRRLEKRKVAVALCSSCIIVNQNHLVHNIRSMFLSLALSEQRLSSVYFLFKIRLRILLGFNKTIYLPCLPFPNEIVDARVCGIHQDRSYTLNVHTRICCCDIV